VQFDEAIQLGGNWFGKRIGAILSRAHSSASASQYFISLLCPIQADLSQNNIPLIHGTTPARSLLKSMSEIFLNPS
jgi:hypothetical protein